MPKARARATPGAGGRGCCGPECCGSQAGCCGGVAAGRCEVTAVVGVDGRGQMVLPKETRERFGIHAGDKLAVAAWNRDGAPCCLTLLKVDELAEAVRRTYGPVLQELLRTG